MKIKVAIWNGVVTRVIGFAEFDSPEALFAYMEEVHKIDPKATYNVTDIIQK